MSNPSSSPVRPWKPSPFRWSGVIGRETAVVWIPGHGDVIVDVTAVSMGESWSWKVTDKDSGALVGDGVKAGSTGRERAITAARQAVVEYATVVFAGSGS